MKFNKFLLFSIIVLLAGLVFADLPAVALAQAGDLGTQCATVTDSTSGCPDSTAANCKILLQKCADYYDQQSIKLAQDLTKTSAQKNTLQNQINSLKKKIQGIEADINQGKIMVKDLNIQISDTQVSIDRTTKDISSSQEQLAAILQSVREEDQKPAFVILLEGNLSDFFGNLAYLDSLNEKVGSLLTSTKKLKTYLADQQVKMGENVDQLQKTIALQTLQKKQNEQNKQEQDQYLKLTEAQYQQQLKDKTDAENKSAKIKAMLFQVVGVTKAPTFGEAIDIAKAVSNVVPIRPAFLLAILRQESAIGKNVGNCLLTDTTTGAGKRVSTGAYMPKVFNKNGYHPNDLSYFLSITSSVNRDPLNSMISCDGFGSMGPAQFLPATWWKFVDRLKTALGHAADPWVIKDSFTASAMLLSDLGAGAQTTTAESNAAYRYNGSGNAARAYSRNVMSMASCIQTFIDGGTMSVGCQNSIF